MKPSGLLTEEDARYFGVLFSPEYVVPAAEEYGPSAVQGARQAFQEVRRMTRRYMRGVLALHRGKFSPKQRVAAMMEIEMLRGALGIDPDACSLGMIEPSPWRQMSRALWVEPAPIGGSFEILVQTMYSAEVLHLATLEAVAGVLADHMELNRCFLEGRVWQRMSPEVLVPVEIESGELRPVVLSPHLRTRKSLRVQLRKRLRRMLELHRHPLGRLYERLLYAWIEHGFIASPAGAQVSLCAETESWDGQAPLNGKNGIPITVCVLNPEAGRIVIGVQVDHRVFDASQSGKIQAGIKRRLEFQLKEGAPE